MKDRSLILGIDTSAANCGLALFEATEPYPLITADVSEINRGHGEAFFPSLDRLLGQAKCTMTAIGRIVTTTGPGSFTGVRVGIAAAKGLGLGLNVDVLGLSTLHLLAAQGLQFDANRQRICAASDAKRNQVYWQMFVRGADGLIAPENAARAERPALLQEKLTADPTILLVGNADKLLTAKDLHPCLPDIRALAGFFQHFDASSLTDRPVATYLRPPDATPQPALFV